MEEIIDKERTTIKSRGHNTGRGGDELNQINLQNKTRHGATTAWKYEKYKMAANKMLPGTWLQTCFQKIR